MANVVRTVRPKPCGYDDMSELEKPAGPFLPVKEGMNRYIWDLRHDSSSKVSEDGAKSGAIEGPLVVPGTYSVSLTVAGKTVCQDVTIEQDPRVSTSADELREQLDLMLQVRDKVTEVHNGINHIRSIRGQVAEWSARATSVGKGDALSEETGPERIARLNRAGDRSRPQIIGEEGPTAENCPPAWGSKLKELMARYLCGLRSDPQQHDVYGVSREGGSALGRLEHLESDDLQRFVDNLHELEIPAIIPKA